MLDAKTQAKMRDGVTHNRGILASMSAVNLGRLFTSLVDPDRLMTPAEKALAEATMMEISGGAKTANNPKYEHKGEAKIPAHKEHEYSGKRAK